MLDSWSTERLVVFGTTELTAPAAARITIGSMGDLVAERPMDVLTAFVREGGSDTTLRKCSTEYLDSIASKDAAGTGYWFSYEGTMPDGTLRLWPVPCGDVHLRCTLPVTQIADPADELVLPPGWNHAMVLNLAVHLCEEYGFAVTPALASTAQTAKANIKRGQIQPARTTFDPALL